MRWVIGNLAFKAPFSKAILLFLVVAGIARTANPQGVSGAATLISDAGYAHLLDAIFPRDNPVS